MKLVPSPRVISMNFIVAAPAENPYAFDMVAYVLSKFPELIDAGVSGYPVIVKKTPNVYDGSGVLISGILGQLIMLDTQRPADITNLFSPIFRHINATWAGFQFYSTAKSFPNFLAWYLDNFDNTPVGTETLAGSRLLDAQALSGNSTATKLAYEKFSDGGLSTAFMVSGKGVWNAKPRGGSNSVCPAWRKAYVHASKSYRIHSKTTPGSREVAKP
jgi:hypothetical protein